MEACSVCGCLPARQISGTYWLCVQCLIDKKAATQNELYQDEGPGLNEEGDK